MLAITDEDPDPILTRIATLKFKIELLLNLKESDHLDIAARVRKLVVCAIDYKLADQRGADRQEIKTHADKIGVLQTKLTLTAQSVLKREWERVKQGE